MALKNTDDLTISYRDLITLRVLAANFPNKVTDKEAPLMQHPNSDCNEAPYLNCRVQAGTTIDVSCKAVPDSGCTGLTRISKHFVKQCGIKVYPTSFKSIHSKVSGQAWISIKIKNQIKINRLVLVANITDDMLLSWRDLIDLGVLPHDFPSPAPESI